MEIAGLDEDNNAEALHKKLGKLNTIVIMCDSLNLISVQKQVEQVAEEAYEDRFVEELRREIERQSDKSAGYNETNGDEMNIQSVDVGSPDYLGSVDTMDLAEEKLSTFAEGNSYI
ncbi:hypothetical protein [Parasitella parasitica]|uniref:Uncharacterized protein n=1 Tax=Parasitella parasitica TaxID=35722 RepID=A0A0B7NCF5_9FUNG|nr:hypothetical protein [Parasitella parasitica]